MKISYNPKSSLAAITPLTAANDDIIFDLYASKLWAKGIRIGADWEDISSKPSSLKNPYALTISLNGTSQGPYDGSAAKNINITPSSIGAATNRHEHDIYAVNEKYGGFKKSERLPTSGFYQYINKNEENGGNAPWTNCLHLINCQHSNTTNNYALLIAANFFDNNTFKIRVTNNNVDNAWRDIIHSGNIGSQTVASATKLLTARNLWGNSFDGTKDINGSIVFPAIGDTATSNKISWSSSSDGADIYYLTTGKDLGNLVLNVKNDTNAYILLALNGVFKSHFDVANSYWTGRSALADKWTTARTFTIGNTAKNVDGSGNVSWSLAEIGVRDTWRTVQVNGTSISTNTLNLCGSTYIGLTNVNGKVTFSLVGSGTTANQAILSNGTANEWTLKTLNIANWDTAYNLRHSHANKSVLDGITSGLVTNWNTAYNFVSTITGTDTDDVINKWDEIVNFLAGITEDNKLNTLLNSKLSILLLAAKEILTTKTNNALYWVDTKANAQSITTGPFTDNPYALLSVTNYNVKQDNSNTFYRSRLAFSSVGDIKVASCHHENEYKLDETWYNVLTSKNSGIDGSTIKLNGTSITVYSSTTADDRYVKKTGDTMTGSLIVNSPNFSALSIQKPDDGIASIQFSGKSGVYGYIGLNITNKDKLFLRWGSNASKTYTILDTSSTYTSNGSGIINGTTITQVDNADKLDGYHASYLNNAPWGTIPVISTTGYFDIGMCILFHYDNTAKLDSSTSLLCTGNYGNRVYLPSQIGTLALTSDNVASATKLQTARTIWGQSFDGTRNVSGNMTDVGIINAMLNLTSKSGNAALYLETVSASTDYVHLFVTNSYDKNNVKRPLILQNGYGNIGIGTISPAYKLHVVGDIYTTTGFKKNGSSDSYVLLGGGGHKLESSLNVANADTVDGYHANGLLTSVTNTNNGISVTVGGTTKSVSNIRVNYANSADSATKVIVNLNITNDIDYPLVWSNLDNVNNVTENQLFKSWEDLYYNPKSKRLFVRGSVNTAYVNAAGTVTSTGFVHSSVTKNANLYVLTADGGYTFFNLTSNELAHEFSKDITVTSEWTDIEDFYGGNLSFLTLPGTYIVLVYYNDSSADGMYEGYFSGIMSWFTGTTNSNNADEIVLHRVGHAYANTIYLRTRESLESETNPYTKLQISANTTLKQHTYKFKFKRIC